MQDLWNTSNYDLYFFVDGAVKAIEGHTDLLDPFCKPALGEGWAAQDKPKAQALRDAVELSIREGVETTSAIRIAEVLTQNVSNWRTVAAQVARNAPDERRNLLLRSVGWGLGHARSVKEVKDLLLVVKERVSVHRDELVDLGLAPKLTELPARVLAKLETGAADVAREKAESDRAQADVTARAAEVREFFQTVWRSADVAGAQARLLAQDDTLSEKEKEELLAQARKAEALGMALDRVLGEAKVQARESASKDPLPPGLAEEPLEPADPLPVPGEQPAA